jgi:hypothetical protein
MDNTPAFPANHFDLGATEHGMTLRDYIAAKAMQGMLSNPGCTLGPLSQVPSAAYEMADAMMKARK